MNNHPDADSLWDAGNLSCGELVMELRRRMRTTEPGHILHVIAHDQAAPIDIAAWCRITGHSLRSKSPPHYFIQRKQE